MIKKIALSSALLLAAAMANAENNLHTLQQDALFVNGSKPVEITLNNKQKKIVRLMSISLSPKAKAALTNKLTYITAHPFQKNLMTNNGLPPSKYVGMNGEPVLDQGQWGTCATFATTAAVNVTQALTDDSMVSQLCNLELGRTLNIPDSDGGWNGSFGFMVFGQINEYGYLDTRYQKTKSCGGLNDYPTHSANNGSPMSAADFATNSIKTFTAHDWTPIVAYDGDFSPLNEKQANAALKKVKAALNQGYRVVFGSLLDVSVGQAGASGSYNWALNDVWVMTPKIKDDVKKQVEIGGHEIIIDGYDDNACASYFDENLSVKQQCGLLRIRNSWSEAAGDKGDYYMTYDHFKGMVIEAYAVGKDVKDKFKL